MLNRSVEVWLAVAFFVLALLGIFLWVPLDSDTPPIYTFRRQTYIGDAMLPMAACVGLALCAAVHLVVSLRRRPDDQALPFDALTLVFFVLLGFIVAGSLVLMYWAGPAALSLFGSSGDEPVTYREMRTTLPWKYIGFVLGGFVFVFGLTSMVEGRVSARRALTAVLAVVVLILVFDVPFGTILLPPNGDF